MNLFLKTLTFLNISFANYYQIQSSHYIFNSIVILFFHCTIGKSQRTMKALLIASSEAMSPTYAILSLLFSSGVIHKHSSCFLVPSGFLS